jgi:hypothetical protein
MSTQSVQVANVIKNQIGVRNLMCWGASNFIAINEQDGGLIFKVLPNPKLRGGGTVKIVLDFNDTYHVQIFNNRKRIIYDQEGIYCDQLSEILWKQLG